MKFTKTAVAVAIAGIAAAPMIASAETTVSGVVQVKIQGDDSDDDSGDSNFASGDVRVGLNSSHALNSGLTGYGNLQMNLDNFTGQGGINQQVAGDLIDTDGTSNDRDVVNLSSGATVSSDNVYVGVKGGFGDIRWGEIPLAVEYGQLGNDIHDVGGTVVDGLSYTGAFGPVSVGLNYSPAPNSDMLGIGAKFNVGGFTIGLGVEDRDERMNAAAGVAFSFAGASIGANFFTQEQEGDADDTESFNVKLGYSISGVSLGFTYSNIDRQGAEQNVIRLDAGYGLGGGMNISTRINMTDNDDGNDDNDPLYYRVMLTKSF